MPRRAAESGWALWQRWAAGLARLAAAVAASPALLACALATGTAGAAVAAVPVSARDSAPKASTTVFRCTPSADRPGAVLYTDQPCPGGVALQASDTRTKAQAQAAQARVHQEGQWAQAQAEQRRREALQHAALAQRQPTVMGRQQVDISTQARRDALREAELRRMARPHRAVPPGPAPEPRAAGGGSAPKAKPDRP